MTHTYKMPYGAFELKHSYQKNMLMGTLSTVLLVAFIITAGWVYMLLQPPQQILEIPVDDGYDGGGTFIPMDPPDIIPGQPEVSIPQGPPPKFPKKFILIDDSLSVGADSNIIFDPQSHGDFGPGNPGDNEGGSNGYQGPLGGTGVVPIPPPDTFIALEEQPIQYLEKKPEYPRLPKECGLEGEVTIQAYVNREGVVIKALAAKCSRPGIGFEEAAVNAAYNCRYRPAIQNSIPIGAWVTYKVRFVLN